MQPIWHNPINNEIKLKISNSLVLEGKIPQEFISKTGNIIKWYTCGPTVYDSSHLGHARNYLTFDIIRRIMEDYFGYNIFYCMNITDIDDKIIIRARQIYFFTKFKTENLFLTHDVKLKIIDALTIYMNVFSEKIDHIKKKSNKQSTESDESLFNDKTGSDESLFNDKTGSDESLFNDKTGSDATINLYQENLNKAELVFKKVIDAELNSSIIEYIDLAEDALMIYLDDLHHKELSAEFIKELCAVHAKHYEKDFFEDMQALGIKNPTIVTRATEYIPEILEMTNKLIDKGYAYPSNGDVYFDTTTFHNSSNHFYGKLNPSAIDINCNDSESESNQKKNSKDFALWKASKIGEPSWQSYNNFGGDGFGRPGWHIECSAMAAKIFGDTIDIHAGGCDLKFPHHDNEMAQAEAYFDNKQWVNYFLHSGHLHINGLKMSKSLKNFITIKDILYKEKYTSTQLRFLFLLQSWNAPFNYQQLNTMDDPNSKIKSFLEFFRKIETLSLDNDIYIYNWTKIDSELYYFLLEKQQLVHEQLCNNFDTKSVIYSLLDLVNAGNNYMKNNERKLNILISITTFIKRILNVFGIDFVTSTHNYHTTKLNPLVKELVTFRKIVRNAVINNLPPSTLLNYCDELRDNTMMKLGIKIIDDDNITDFLIVDPNELINEENQRKRKLIEIQIKKIKNTIDKFERSQVLPQDIIFSQFNTRLLSLPDTKPDMLSPKTWKNIQTIWKKQEKFNQTQDSDQNTIIDLKETLRKLELSLDN